MAVTAPPLTLDCRVPYNGRADNNRADLLSQASGIFRMQALVFKITVVFILLSVLQDFQVQALPLPTKLDGLLQRTRRSLLWRWNTLKPVGGSCRAHTECGTNYCNRNNICSFWLNSP